MSDELASKRRIRSAILPALVTVAVVIPNLVVITLGIEDFPFTTAPMFAHYVGPDTRLYAFRIEGIRDDTAEPLPIRELNLDEQEVARQLASWYYRPMTDTSPFRELGGDHATPEQFAATMSRFFRPITDFLREKRGIAYDRVDLYVDIVDSGGTPLATEYLGHYDTATGEYTQTDEVTR